MRLTLLLALSISSPALAQPINGSSLRDGRPAPASFAGVGVPSRSGATSVIESVITATADARDLAPLGDRVLVASEGGVIVLHGGAVERVLGPRDGLPGARTRSVSVTDEGAWIGGVEGTALLSSELRVVRTLPLRRVRRAVHFAGQTWLASFGDGLHRWDGSELHQVSLGRAHAYVRLTDLAVHDGELWVATSGVGILRVGPDGRLRGRIRARDGLPADYVWRLVAHEDRVLALTVDGVADIGAAGVDRASAITATARRLPVRDVRALAIDGDELHLATFGRGLFRARVGERPRAVRGGVTEANALARVDGALLVGHSRGVHRVGDRAEPLVSGGLPSGDVTALARAFGTLWAGTFGDGLARMRGGAFEAVREAHERWGVDRRINDLVATDDRLWIATDRGLYWHDGRIFSPVEDPSGPGRVHTTALHVDRAGALWVATTRHLCRHRHDRWRCWTGDASLPNEERSGVTVGRHLPPFAGVGMPSRSGATHVIAQLHAITTDARGRVWVGSLHGLYRFEELRSGAGRFHRHTVSSGALPVDWITALVPWGDGVMAGTYHGGLVIYDGARFRSVREEDGLPSGWVNPHALRRVGDEVWIGTLERGLVTGRPGAWRHLTRADGLPSDDVTDVLAERDAIWIATRGGLARIAR